MAITSDILSPVQLIRRCLKTPLLVLEWSFGANRDFAVIEAIFIHGGQLVRRSFYRGRNDKSANNTYISFGNLRSKKADRLVIYRPCL